MSQPTDRICGYVTSAAVAEGITSDSILCLPLGSFEQHGPHLPLATDTIIAEAFAAALTVHAAEQHDLWVLPPVPIGLSHEHRWAPGTATLRLDTFAMLVMQVVTEHIRSTRARRLLIVNGHGGNRTAIQTLLYELEDALCIAACALHPLALAGAGKDAATPEVHAGFVETSLLLHLAPHLVNLPTGSAHEQEPDNQRSAIHRAIFEPGVSWPWRSNDPALSVFRDGVIGDWRGSDPDLGRKIMSDALRASTMHLDRLAERDPDSTRRDRPCS